MSDKPDDLEMTKDLFEFLQGDLKNCKIARKRRVKLTADQAWTVIWYLGSQYWQVTDHIERCDVCGEIYDSSSQGDCLDYGGFPYHFCDNCRDSDHFTRKMRRNPDKNERDNFFRD